MKTKTEENIYVLQTKYPGMKTSDRSFIFIILYLWILYLFVTTSVLAKESKMFNTQHDSSHFSYIFRLKVILVFSLFESSERYTEAVAQRCSLRRMFLEISQNSQEFSLFFNEVDIVDTVTRYLFPNLIWKNIFLSVIYSLYLGCGEGNKAFLVFQETILLFVDVSILKFSDFYKSPLDFERILNASRSKDMIERVYITFLGQLRSTSKNWPKQTSQIIQNLNLILTEWKIKVFKIRQK